MSTGNTMGDHPFGNTSRDGALDDGGHRVHGSHDFGLELGRNMEFDLLEEVFGGAKSTHYQDVLESGKMGSQQSGSMTARNKAKK